jgi:hypothetical protein
VPWGVVALTTRHHLPTRVGNNFADKRQPTVGIALLQTRSHGVLFDICCVVAPTVSSGLPVCAAALQAQWMKREKAKHEWRKQGTAVPTRAA